MKRPNTSFSQSRNRKDENVEKMFSKNAKLLWSVVLLLAWGFVFALLFHLDGELTVENILNYQPEKPVLAVAVMLGLYLLKSVDFILYSPILYAASGIMFPLPFALLLNMTGVAIMATTPYLIGRSLGPPVIGYLRNKYPKLQIMERLHLCRDTVAAFLLRMLGLPLIPVSLYLGAVEFPYGKYLLGSILGLLPVTICATVLGTTADTPDSPAFWIALGVQIFCMASSVIIYAVIQKKTGNVGERE